MTPSLFNFTSPEPLPIVVARLDMARRLSWAAVAVALIVFFGERLIGAPFDADSVLILVFAALSALAAFLLNSPRYAWAAWLLPLSGFVVASASSYVFGSVRTMEIGLLVVSQVAVGIFLSRRALIGSTAAAVLLLGVLTLADASGWLGEKPDFSVGLRSWLAQAACLVGVALMMYLNRTQMRAAQRLHLQEAHRRLASEMGRDQGLERFKRIFSSSPAPIYVQSLRHGVITDANPAFEMALGYRRKKVVTRRDDFLFVNDEAFRAFAKERRSARRTRWHAVTALDHDGREVPMAICAERDESPEDGLVITAMRLTDGPLALTTPYSDSQPVSDGVDDSPLDEGGSHA